MLPITSRLDGTSVYLTETPFRGRALAEYGSWLGRVHGAWRDPIEAFEQVLARVSPEDLVVVTGSLNLVGRLLEGKVAGPLSSY